MTPGARDNRNDSLAYGIAALAILVHLLLHFRASLSFPIPWPDEAHFLWQAYTICTSNTLFCDALNSYRIIMWIPPGYPVLVGLFFKLAGTSYEAARLFSFVTLSGAFVLLLRYLISYGQRWLALVFLSLVFLNDHFVACGNIGRMEAPLLMFVVGGYLLIQRRQALAGLALLALSPLLHFNGFYFLVGGAAYAGYLGYHKHWRRELNIYALILAALALLGWAAYALLIAFNWDGFVNDMTFQFARKGARNILPEMAREKYFWMAGALLVSWLYARRADLRARELLFLGIPAWLAATVGLEMWYEPFGDLANLLFALFIFQVIFHFVQTQRIVHARWAKSAALLLILAFLIRWSYKEHLIENIVTYPATVDFAGMRIDHGVPYFIDEDREAVSGLLHTFAGEMGTLAVGFEPTADSYFFADMHGPTIRMKATLFEKERIMDMIVVHWSRSLPNWWGYNDIAVGMGGLTRDSTRHILYSRDSTEQWYFVALSEKMKSSEAYRQRITP